MPCLDLLLHRIYPCVLVPFLPSLLSQSSFFIREMILLPYTLYPCLFISYLPLLISSFFSSERWYCRVIDSISVSSSLMLPHSLKFLLHQRANVAVPFTISLSPSHILPHSYLGFFSSERWSSCAIHSISVSPSLILSHSTFFSWERRRCCRSASASGFK